MSKLPKRGDTCSHVCGVLQADIRARRNVSVSDFIEFDRPAELLCEGPGDQSAGPGLRVSAGEPPTHLHMIGTNRRVPAVTVAQLTHPPAEPFVTYPGLAHNRC
ncbi:MAG: hypothetical protein ACRDR6_17550 [Pseudonocardiaceae bacterium]